MSKTYSLKELTIMAGEVLKANPDVNKVLATTDGNIFFESGKNAAELHSKNNGNLTIHEIVREGTVFKEEKKESNTPAEVDALPNKKSTVVDIKSWMTKQEVAFEETDTKDILLEKIQKHLDDLATNG